MDIINLTKGEKVIYNDKEVIITKLNTLDTVTIEELSNGTNHLVHVSDLKPIFKKKEKLDDINVNKETNGIKYLTFQLFLMPFSLRDLMNIQK